MKYPLILQDINNKVLSKNFVINKNNFFIKSYKRFDIQIVTEYEIDLEGNAIEVIDKNNTLNLPMIYSVTNNGIVNKAQSFSGVNNNYSYTIYLGQIEKKVTLEIYDIDDVESNNPILIVIDYKPDNVLLESQQHYSDIITNKDLPTLDKLLPAIIIDENKSDLIKRLLLDFKEIKQHRGKLKSIEKFLYFIGFNDDNIKLYPEYITPSGIKTINPNKLFDVKSGFYHVHYDNFIIDENDKYTRKNLPKFELNVIDFNEFFDKLFYALTLANDYFTIPEQQMSFFGISNMVNSEQYLSVTSTMNQVHYIDTINFHKHLHIDIYNRTQLDSFPLYIISNNIIKHNTVKRSEVKILVGNNPILNNQIYKIDREFTDNGNVTDLTEEEQLQIKYVFGNVFHIDINSPNTIVEYYIVNVDNELIQYKSSVHYIQQTILSEKIFIKNDGKYNVVFKVKDYHGNYDQYSYLINITGSNIDFKLFSSNKINQIENELTQDIDSPILTDDNITTGNLRLIDSENNTDLLDNLSNYFQVTQNYDSIKLLGEQQFKLKNVNHNTLMKNLSETITSDFIDNFQHFIAFKKLSNYDYVINSNENNENENLLYIIMNISNDVDTTTEEYYLITTEGIATDINSYLNHIEISSNVNDDVFTLKEIINKELPEEFNYSTIKLPINYDYEFDDVNVPSVYPRLNLQTNEILKQGDIVVCKMDNNLIVNDKNVEWQLVNSFTKEVLLKQKQKTFKFRIEDNFLYDIILNLTIDDKVHQVNKKSILTSFL